MKPILLALCIISPAALACDTSHLSLSGTANVQTCSPNEASDCVYAGEAVHQYMEKVPDSDAVLTIGLQSSPWRLYDGEMRILAVDELVGAVRPKLNDTLERIELIGSWTGVSPAPGVASLAERVSKALDGLPVKGEDGFLWLAQDGTRRTTRQAFTLREGAGSYFLPKGSEVLVPLAAGWPAYVQDRIPEDDAGLLMRAAAGWDVFFLCPDKALAGFEHAAEKGSAIAAYNAALMRLERDADGDRTAALALLERGAALGDAKSRTRLDAERTHK
jgi:hypothetical protein